MANEEIRAKAEAYGAEMSRVPFLCECAREDCNELVRVPLMEYTRIRSESNHFLIAPDHEAAEQSQANVVRREDGYAVVEKIGAARDVLERQSI